MRGINSEFLIKRAGKKAGQRKQALDDGVGDVQIGYTCASDGAHARFLSSLAGSGVYLWSYFGSHHYNIPAHDSFATAAAAP